MELKKIVFSSFLIIIDNEPIKSSQFYNGFVNNDSFDTIHNDINYTISTTKYQDLAYVYLQLGNPLPRPEKVINTQTHKKEKNPRTEHQYEPKQEFVIIDFQNSNIWLSNTKRKSFILDLFKEKFESDDIILKNVYSEKEFIDSIRKIDEIKFSALPNLFSQENTLTKELAHEILGYGASVATLIMKFPNDNIGEKIIRKIKNLLSRKEVYKSLVISGRDENDFGIIFNNEFLSKRIQIKAKINENEILDMKDVFSKFKAKLYD